MSKTQIPEDIAALARKIGKQFKSEQDLAVLSRGLEEADLTVSRSQQEDVLGARHLLPYAKCSCAEQPVIRCTKQMPAVAEQVAHPSVNREKTLGLMRRLEPTHLSLPLPGRLMRHFRPIIGVLGGVVMSFPQNFPDGWRVASQPIGN